METRQKGNGKGGAVSDGAVKIEKNSGKGCKRRVCAQEEPGEKEGRLEEPGTGQGGLVKGLDRTKGWLGGGQSRQIGEARTNHGKCVLQGEKGR